MSNIAERGTIQPQEQGRIDKILHSPMSRRTFIKRAGAVLLSAEIAAACGVPAGATATAKPTSAGETTPVTSFVPESIKPVDIPTLSSDTFNKVFGYYTDTTEINVGSKQVTVKDLTLEASNIWNDGNLTSITISRNAVESLKFALSASELAGDTGTVDFSRIFKGLSLELPRFSISTLTNGKDTEEASNVLPSNLPLRKGMDMTVVGIDDAKGNAIVAFSDTLRKPDNSPTMYFASIPVEASSSQLSFSELLARNGATYDSNTHSILYTNGKPLPIYKLDPTLSQSLEQAEGSFFLDIDPLRTKVQGKTVYEANPVIAPLPSEFSKDKIVQLKDGRVAAEDATGKLVARARYSFGQSSWEWATDKESLADYTIREYADAEGITVGTFVFSPEMTDPSYVFALEATANQLFISSEVDMTTVFKNFTTGDWEKLVKNWSGISASLDKGIVPDGFSYDWTDADNTIAFAQREHMSLRGQALVFGSPGVLDSIYQGNFSSSDLAKILEFAVKTRVIQYKGKITEWEGVSEASANILYGGEKQRFWYDKLGENVIDNVFQWAHQADPSATLTFTDDHILEPNDDPNLTNKYLSFLRHFKQAGIPVNKASIEDNFWIYAPPIKQDMIDVLTQIKNMGYEIGAPETTVVTGEVWPVYPARAKTVAVTNKNQAQANIYMEAAQAYIQVFGKKAPIGLGGFDDAYEWYGDIGYPSADAMIFNGSPDPNGNLTPKTAYYTLLDVVKAQI